MLGLELVVLLGLAVLVGSLVARGLRVASPVLLLAFGALHLSPSREDAE